MKKTKTPHALVLAHCATGHLVPAFILSKELAANGILVTIVGLDPELSNLISKHKSEVSDLPLLKPLPLPRPPEAVIRGAEAIGAAKAGVTVNQHELAEMLRKSFENLKIRDKLFVGNPEPPTCIIASMFCLYSKGLALQLQIPRYMCFGSGAQFVRLMQAMVKTFAEGTLRLRNGDSTLEEFDGQISIPGLPGLRFHELSPALRHSPKFFLNFSLSVMDADGIFINTFDDLEPDVINCLRKFAWFERQKFYAVGPLGGPSIAAELRPDSDKDLDCFSWLDSQSASSVVYICFGSSFQLTSGQVSALSRALERTRQRFIWVLPPSDPSRNMSQWGRSEADLLPGANTLHSDFDERVEGFGYMLRGWAPQIRILSHRSTGAFLTHCGWNSLLEAIALGVPMITWPIGADQYQNSRYVVSELKAATAILQGGETQEQDSLSDKVERAIRLLMEEEEGKAIKLRLKELQASLASARTPEGSSTRALHAFIEDITNM